MADIQVRPTIDQEAAFDLYLTKAGRSFLVLSELTGIPLGTIRTWSTRNSWKDRADAIEYQARRANRQHILSVLDAGMPTALTNIQTLMTDATTERVKLDASKHWAELWGKYRDLVDAGESSADDDGDVSSLSDADLFAELKRQSHR